LKPAARAAGNDRRGNCAARQLVAKIKQLLQVTVGRFSFQQSLPFDFEGLESLSQPLVFAAEAG